MATIETKLMTPSVPNFIRHDTPARARHVGMQESAAIDIADLTDETLRDIAEEWKDALIEAAHHRREDRRTAIAAALVSR